MLSVATPRARVSDGASRHDLKLGQYPQALYVEVLVPREVYEELVKRRPNSGGIVDAQAPNAPSVKPLGR
jgi:hypothetical protein